MLDADIIAPAQRPTILFDERLLEVLPAAVYVCNIDGVVVRYNKRAAELWGRSPVPGDANELYCGAHRLYLPDGSLLPHNQTPMVEAMRSGTSYRNLEVQVEQPNGSRVWILVSIDPLKDDDNNIIGAINCFQDITERKVAQALLADEQRTAKLREEFIAVLGHDLRTPLSAILSGADLLAQTSTDAKTKALVEMIEASGSRMSGLIDDVLDFARGRLGSGLALDFTDEDLEPLITQAIAEVVAKYPDHKLLVEIDVDRKIRCDPKRIGQLVSNLLGNAFTYGANDVPIKVSAKSTQSDFELSITNGGKPISPAALERLFEPFTRGSVTPGQGGLGLGLFIASEIAKAHGGTLSATSTPEETRFRFRMPR